MRSIAKAMQFINLEKWLFCFLLLVASPSLNASPIHGCTFYQDQFRPSFMGCAAPKIHRRTCKKVKGTCPLCVTYKGDRGSMYLPDFLIEVTEKWGDSMFEHASPAMKSHLELAKSYFSSKTIPFPPPMVGTEKGGESPEGESYFWHARILATPYNEPLIYPSLSPPGSPLPICFGGISEFFFDQWHLGLMDLPFAMALAPVGIPLCWSTSGAAANGALSTALANAREWGGSALGSAGKAIDFDMPALQQGCAYPVGAKIGLGLNLNPSSDALNPLKLCMGSLGNLLPREGMITSSDRFRSAVMAAWRFASLVKTLHPMSMAGMDSDYKWQLVYPRSTHSHCFRPGTLEDFPTGPVEFGRSLAAFTDLSSAKTNTYVFAIWRKRSTHCMEPEAESTAWLNLVKAEYELMGEGCSLAPKSP